MSCLVSGGPATSTATRRPSTRSSLTASRLSTPGPTPAAIADLTAALVPSSIAILGRSGGSWAARWSVSVSLVPLPASRMTSGVAAISASPSGRRRLAHG